MILAWISSRYECWDQSSFSLIHIKTYMNQHQYGQANSRFLISSSSWLNTPNTHFNIYLHTSSLIKAMQSDFPNLYPYKQTNIETDLYPIWVVSFVIWPLLGIFSLMHSWFILQPWSKLIHYQTLLVHTKQATYIRPFHVIISCIIYRLPNIFAFPWCHDIPHIEAISSTPFALLSFSWTRLFP